MKTILKYTSGSILYGTDTENSDLDIQGIYREDLSRIVLGRSTETLTWKNGLEGKDKIEISMKELRLFIRDALSGRSYALESLFIPERVITCTSREYQFIRANRDKLLTDLKPLVRYCKAQAEQYLTKGERLQSLLNVVSHFEKFKLTDKIGEHPLYLDKYCFTHEQEDQNGREETLYEVSFINFHLNVTIKHILTVLRNKIKGYGNRSIESLTNGADFKSYSHAIRLGYQFLDLVKFREIKFPCENAKHLRDIKLGKYSVEEVKAEMEEVLSEVERTEYNFPKPDTEFWEDWLVWIYKES